MSTNETPADVIREAAGPDWRRPRGSESAADHLTVRDHFAASAITLFSWPQERRILWPANAAACFEIADELLKARSK